MTHSESIANLSSALVKVQKAIKPAKRTATDADGKRYADIDSVWRSCRSLLARHGLSIVQGGGYSDIETVLLHESGEWLCLTAKCEPKGNGEVAYGARWAIMRLLGVTEEAEAQSTVREVTHDEVGKYIELIAHVYGDVKSSQVYLALDGLSAAQKLVTLRRYSQPGEILEEAERLKSHASSH